MGQILVSDLVFENYVWEEYEVVVIPGACCEQTDFYSPAEFCFCGTTLEF